MAEQTLRVTCACGWETVGTEDEVVPATQEHGRRVHNMEATRDEVLSMSSPAPVLEVPNLDDLQVVDNPPEHRYEARLRGTVLGFSTYRLGTDRIVFIHTEVDPAFEGQGVGSRLAAGELDDVRKRGLKVVAKCPFIAAWLKRHSDYDDLLAS